MPDLRRTLPGRHDAAAVAVSRQGSSSHRVARLLSRLSPAFFPSARGIGLGCVAGVTLPLACVRTCGSGAMPNPGHFLFRPLDQALPSGPGWSEQVNQPSTAGEVETLRRAIRRGSHLAAQLGSKQPYDAWGSRQRFAHAAARNDRQTIPVRIPRRPNLCTCPLCFGRRSATTGAETGSSLWWASSRRGNIRAGLSFAPRVVAAGAYQLRPHWDGPHDPRSACSRCSICSWPQRIRQGQLPVGQSPRRFKQS